MRRIVLVSALLLLLVAAPAPALAARMSPATNRAISKLVDSFVKDVILRPGDPKNLTKQQAQNLAAGWNLVGPDMRFGTTRAAWVRDTGVTAENFPATGRDFSHAWTGKLVSPNEADIQIGLRSGGKNAEVIFAPTVVRKVHGRWVVDIYYEAGIVRTGAGHRNSCASASCAITGTNDFGPGPSAAGAAALPPSDAAHWVWVTFGGVGALIFGTLAGIVFYVRRRNRRAVQAYEVATGRR